ncbi:MAG TPA: YqhA family protein [Acidimicrobiales bacterium]|nr:YqhA family protein [Acidimicrobiales bacterium]
MEAGFEWGLALSRGLVVVPVVVLVLSALGAFAYGTDLFVNSVGDVIGHPLPVGNNIGLFLLVVDLFLIGATLLIAAVGFYELFISRVDLGTGVSRMPAWLEMRDLNDLKGRVIAMLVLVAAVSFVEVVVDFRNGLEVLELGAGVALVIGALTAFLRLSSQGRGEG